MSDFDEEMFKIARARRERALQKARDAVTKEAEQCEPQRPSLLDADAFEEVSSVIKQAAREIHEVASERDPRVEVSAAKVTVKARFWQMVVLVIIGVIIGVMTWQGWRWLTVPVK